MSSPDIKKLRERAIEVLEDTLAADSAEVRRKAAVDILTRGSERDVTDRGPTDEELERLGKVFGEVERLHTSGLLTTEEVGCPPLTSAE